MPGIFFKAVTAKDRRPVDHLSAWNRLRKENIWRSMRTFADRGFAAAAIDARHHGERIRSGTQLEQYFEAMLETYRTGKGVRTYMTRSGTRCG